MKRTLPSLVRPHLREFVPYSAARSIGTEGELLDANEAPCDAWGATEGFNRYPDPSNMRLRSRIADLNGVAPSSVFVGCGSDEIIAHLITLFCTPGADSIAVLEPTYGMYGVTARVQGVCVRGIPLAEGFQVEVGLTARAWRKSLPPKLLFLCSPNNPTGTLVPLTTIRQLAAAIDGVLVVDEAYIEFASAASSAELLVEAPNLVVLRTLSKAWGLAGLRIGYALAGVELIDMLLRIKAPYNVPTPATQLALDALATPGRMERTVRGVIRERERMIDRLGRLDIVQTIFPSSANFLLVRLRHASWVARQLRASGVLVRDRSDDPSTASCIRITIGSSEANDRLITTLQRLEQAPEAQW